MRRLVWLDLCSGLGGASQPALDRGWTVIRVDIDPRFKPTIVCDLRDTQGFQEAFVGYCKGIPELDALSDRPIDVIWASPVCTDFAKWGMRNWYPCPPSPDLTLSLAVKKLIDKGRPRHWIVENVRASRPWLNLIFGRPLSSSVSHVFYGSIPCLLPQVKAHKGGRLRDRKRNTAAMRIALGLDPSAKLNDADMAALRAKIPYEIGEAICVAVERRREEVAVDA